jgi:ABC-type polysaccharide/polyol phosphate export permease
MFNLLFFEKKIKIVKRVWGLSLQLAKAQFKLRNEGSYLGVFWYLLNPLLMFSLLFLIFAQRLGTNIPNYSVYLLIGIVMFNFFQGATIEATRSIIAENAVLIKSINFPRESLILGIVIKNLFSHFFEIIMISFILIYFNISFFGIIGYFFILIFFCIFVFGFSLTLSALTVYISDVENIWNFGVRLVWFGTPIFYAIEGQTKLFYLNLLNPMFYFITIARDILIYNQVPETYLIMGVIFYSFLFLGAGLFVFEKLKYKFAELI